MQKAKKYVMALDQGTTSSRCILFDRSGKVCSVAQKEFAQYYPQPGWVEHNPMEIWSSQLSVAVEAMGQIGAEANDIAAIGITNQRETTICFSKKTGKPVYPAIVWQCRRTADKIDALKKDGFDKVIRERTGLIPDAYFSATKICWILEHVEGARQMAEDGELLFGTVDTWLMWNLTKGQVFATDYTNASRTMLFDIHKRQWDPEILDYFQIPKSMLPEVLPSSGMFGVTEESVIGGEIPIAGAAGDQQAALFGQCCFDAGEAKNTYGTGCFLLMNTGEKPIESQNGLLTTIAASGKDEVRYALEGSVFVDRLNALLELLDRLIKGERTLDFREFDMSNYFQVLTDYKRTHMEEIIKQLGSMESFDEMISELKANEGHIAQMAVKQNGSIEKFTKAMEENLQHFLENGPGFTQKEADEAVDKTDTLTKKLTADLSKEAGSDEVQKIAGELGPCGLNGSRCC